jgi:two-component system sensor histidine kinase DesK
MNSDAPGLADDGLRGYRRIILSLVIALVLLQPTTALFKHPMTASDWFQLVTAIVLVALVLWRVWISPPGAQPTPWLILAVILALAIALFVVGGKSGDWLAALAFAAAMCGRYSATPAPAIVASAACAIAGYTVASIHHYNYGSTFAAIAIGPLAGLFAYGAGRRADALESLRRTRAELARAAVAEERLRIARDLHDLLGHSLSLIALKAELARRVIGTDPDRASREVAELETVARQSLSDVREAVAGFRQPDLAGELAAARQLLDAAGIAVDIRSAGADDLAQPVDAALAWAVREGATNVVRHSRATKVSIRVSTGDSAAIAEISDNGRAAASDGNGARSPAALTTPAAGGRAGADRPAAGPGPGGQLATAGPAVAGRAGGHWPRPAFTGSGLAGLAERVRSLGGELAAGAVEPHGFLLRVVVPLSQQA